MTSFRESSPKSMRLIMTSLSFALKKQLSPSSAAWFCSLYPDSSKWDMTLLTALQQAINQAISAFHSQLLTTIEQRHMLKLKKDPRVKKDITNIIPEEQQFLIHIFTDYEALEIIFRDYPDLSTKFLLTKDQEIAQFIVTCKHVRDFLSLPFTQRICQFPYESAFIRKVSNVCLFVCLFYLFFH
jgi:hypothetical protein